MDTPICFTQYFVDKQNVRSYGNILKPTLLKAENETSYLQNIFENNSLVSQLPNKIVEILSILRANLQTKSKQDFKNYFLRETNSRLEPLDKGEIYTNCWNALLDILPKILFGNKHNENVLKKVVLLIIYGMKRQHILFGKHLKKWDMCVQPWSLLSKPASQSILYCILSWILQNILAAMVCLNYYVTTCKLDGDENKLHFFWKEQWQSFYDKTIQKIMRRGVIRKVEPYSLGKKIKRSHDLNRILKLQILKKEIPKLHVVLKVNNDFRPIIRYKNENVLNEKYKLRDRLKLLQLLTRKPVTKLELEYTTLYLKWLESNKPKLYFVKSDLSNAFGSVNKEKLTNILNERFLLYQKNEKDSGLLERNTRIFKELIVELRKPILIRAGSTIFVWRKGLVQGYKYSPALSELYYTYLDELYFINHLKRCASGNNLTFFVRVVDDYLYVTDSMTDAEQFLSALSKYENVNYDKTVINFNHINIKFSDEITFLGYHYKTNTLQVSRALNVFTGQMCYKISLNNSIDNIYKFLEARIGQSSVKINGHIFNFIYNNEELVWEHVFTTFCLSANKFCTILALLCDEDEMRGFIQLYKKKVTVRLGNAIVGALSRNKEKDFEFMYCINHFRYMSWLALTLCAKQTPKCNKLVSFINDELAKSNCIFGKWKVHASRIDHNGTCLKTANKSVCRRLDLRVIMKKFVALPNGLQCYNQKLLIKNK